MREGKAYLLTFACALTMGETLEFLHSQEKEGFIKCFKHFMQRTTRDFIYSDNGPSFNAATNNWRLKTER